MLQPKPFQAFIRAVLFDLDGTLRHNDPLAHHFFFDHAISLGAEDSTTNRRGALRWAHLYWNGKGEVLTDSEIHGYDTPEFWLTYAHKYLTAFNCPPEQADALAPELTRHMQENYAPTHRVDDGAPGILKELRTAGYILGVVSNRDQPFIDLLDSLELHEHFDFALAAGEVQSWKPAPEIFEHALEIASVQAGETVYVGDNYFADVVGARGAGLHPVLYDPENVFPDADCAVIASLGGLKRLLPASIENG